MKRKSAAALTLVVLALAGPASGADGPPKQQGTPAQQAELRAQMADVLERYRGQGAPLRPLRFPVGQFHYLPE